MNAKSCLPESSPLRRLHKQFLNLLPRIELHAQIYFRHLKCTAQRSECVAETVALCWKWFLHLVQKGKDVGRFVTVLASYAARAVRCGRRLCGQERSKDVMSKRAQLAHCFQVENLSSSPRTSHEDLYGKPNGQKIQDAFEERFRDNTITPPPDAAAFRIDFPRFIGCLAPRDQKMAMFLSLGHTARTAARKFGVSPGRVTQLRQEWRRLWENLTEPQAQTTNDPWR